MITNRFSRSFLLTIAYPLDKGMTHSEIKKRLSNLDLLYWCMADESSHNVYHTHVFFYADTPVGFDFLRLLFPETHIDVSPSLSLKEARAYVWKECGAEKKEPNTTIYPSTREQWFKTSHCLAQKYYM